MNYLELARKIDATDRPVEAAIAYELALSSDIGGIADWLDLAVLYFEWADFGYASHHGLSRELVDLAWRRMGELLDGAERRFGPRAEIDFWRLYSRFVVLGEQHFKDKCVELAEKKETLVPYFYLFAFVDESLYRPEAMRLYEEVREGSTSRQRYIKGILGPRLLGSGPFSRTKGLRQA